VVSLGVLGNIKELYYSLEDKYYAFLDKVEHVVPIYGIVDPIDKIVPSFLLLILLVCAAIAGFFVFFQAVAPAEVNLSIELVDIQGEPVKDANVEFVFEEKTLTQTSDAVGKVSVKVPANAQISVSVSAGEFDEATKTIITQAADVSDKITLVARAPMETTVTFTDAAGKKITGKKISVRLSCSNTAVKPAPEVLNDEEMDGEIKIMPPLNCGTLGFVVLGPSGFKQNYYIIRSNSEIIMLEAADIPYGAILVKISDSAGNLLAGIDADALAYKDDTFEKKASSSYGEARIMELEPGTYSILVQDNSLQYANATKSNVEVDPKQTTTIEVKLAKSTKGKVNVAVIDSVSNAHVTNATVELRATDDSIIGSDITGSDGKTVSFPILDKIEMKLAASADNYLPGELANIEADNNYTVKLEKLTAYNSGRVWVRIYDEDSLPVQNAKVKLRHADTKTLAPYATRISDANGVAKFLGVKPGNYFAYAEKYPASGESLPDETRLARINFFDINMVIGTATITINAVDEDNRPIAEAEAEIKAENGEKIGTIPLTNGSGSYTLKADKKIFVIAKHADYLPYQSESYQLYRDSPFTITAVLPKQILSAGPKIALLGVFSEAGERVEKLQAGNDYIARLQLKIPQDSAYSEAGMHFRTGDAATITNDNIVIKEINAGAVSFIKGTSFNAPKGYDIDSSEENLTEGDAKWVNLWWAEPKPAVYNASIKFRVKTQTVINSLLPFYYRAWAIEGSNYFRDPVDNELAQAFDTGEKQALYANAFAVKDYFEGTDKECDNAFCYTGIRVFDNSEGLYGYEPFAIGSGGDYNFLFTITSNSEADFTGAKFYLSNVVGEETTEQLEIRGYEIVNASAQKYSYRGNPVYEIGLIDSGNLGKNKSVNGNIFFRPRTEEASAFRLRIVFEGKEVTKKDFAFDVTGKKDLALETRPEKIPAFVETDLNVVAKDTENDFELKDALIKLTIEAPDHSKIFQEKTTNTLGVAVFNLPALLPRTRILLEAFKKGYKPQAIEKRIDSNVLSFSPAEATANLKYPGKTEEIVLQKVTNQIERDLAISNLRLIGSYKGILDETKMVNYLQQWIGHKFSALATEEDAKIFKLALMPGLALGRNMAIKGNFLVETKPIGYNASFPQNVPFVANIGLPAGADNSPCITIDEFKWEGTTQNNAITHAFQIQNNCRLDNSDIPLANLQAKLEWKSPALGTVELTITDADDPGNSNTEVLQEAIWANMLNNIREQGTFFAVLTFTPKTGHIGETAKFNVIIDGQLQTSSGASFVGANKKIEAELLISNLEQCLKIDPEDEITIAAGEQEAKFSIDSSKCGKLEINFILCKGDNGCRGGSTEGSIIVSPQEFSLSPDNSKKTITIKRQSIPGMYGIGISARTPGHSYREVAIVDALIEPEEDASFSLDKYAFVIKGTGSKDSATLTNKPLSQEVTVNASVCDWGEVSKKDKKKNNMAMLAAGIGALMGMLQGLNEMGAADTTKEGMQQATKTSVDTVDRANKATLEAVNKGQESAGQAQNVKSSVGEIKSGIDGISKSQMKQLNQSVEELAQNADCKAVSACSSALSAMKTTNLTKSVENAQKQLAPIVSNSAKLAETASKALAQTQTAFRNIQDSANKALGASLRQFTSKTIPSSGLSSRLQGTSANIGRQTFYSADAMKSMGEALASFQEAAKIGTQLAKDIKKFADDTIGAVVTEITTIKTASNAVRACLVVEEKKQDVVIAGCNTAGEACRAACSATATGCKPACTAIEQACIKAAQAAKAKIASCTQSLDKADAKIGAMETATNDLQKNIKDMLNDDGTIGKFNNSIKDLLAKDNGFDAAKKAMEKANAETNNTVKDLGSLAKATEGTSSAAGKGGAYAKVALNTLLGALTGLLAGNMMQPKEEDPCDTMASHPLSDYVINLKTDARGIAMDHPNISAAFDFTDAKVFGDWEKQTVGIAFTNNGVEQDRPVYSVATITATKHYHSKTTTIPRGTKFGPFDIPDASTEDYTQKFHLKFKTKDSLLVLQPEQIDVPSCTQGAMLGKTTAAALPRIKLNWSWNDVRGIAKDSCLASNPNYVYCDATQFSIMLTKRLKALDEWLKINGANLKCPPNQMEAILNQITNNVNNNVVQNGFIGIGNVSAAASGNTATVSVRVDNNTSSVRSVTVQITINAPSGVTLTPEQGTCSRDANNIAARGSQTVSCVISGLQENAGYYSAQARLVSSTVQPLDPNSILTSAFRVGAAASVPADYCWIEKSTQFYDGKSALEWYAESTPGIQWTANIPNMLALRNFVQSDAYLVYDAYTEDFRKDFADYYSRISFYDTPSYFHQSAQQQNFKKFFETNALTFGVKFTDSERLPSAGLYRVDLNMDFSNGWKLFNTDGSIAAKIKAIFYHLNEPVPNSIMYYVPFDGGIGKQGSALSRQGYGVQFDLAANETLKINNAEQLFALPGAGSNALVDLKVEKQDSLKALNSLASRRGFLLSIEQGASTGEKKLVWTPSNATPVLAKVKQGLSQSEFSVFYSARNNNVPEITGNTLTYWSGAGSCYDFSGQLASEAFDFKPDRKARQTDNLQGWQTAYALDWSGSVADGSVFLKTIMFTPIGANYSLFAEKTGIAFQSPDSAESNAVGLRGVSSMAFNRSGTNDTDRVNSIEDVLGLVESTAACVTNSGVRTSFWWNPEEIYSQEANGKSIKTIENSLNPTKQCITSMEKTSP